MDRKEIDRARIEGFTLVRRGYDRREVDKFVLALQDWLETDAATDLGDVAIQRKLELVGKSTSEVLMTAEKQAEQTRRRVDEECARVRADADANALAARSAADDYAKKTRGKSDADARKMNEAAVSKARATVEAGDHRRAQIEAVIAELDARREEALKALGRLHSELGATVAKHGGGARPPVRNGAKEDERFRSAKAPQAVRES